MSRFQSGKSAAGENHQLFASNIRSTTANTIKVRSSQIPEFAADKLEFVNPKGKVRNLIATFFRCLVNKDIGTAAATQDIQTKAAGNRIVAVTAVNRIVEIAADDIVIAS